MWLAVQRDQRHDLVKLSLSCTAVTVGMYSVQSAEKRTPWLWALRIDNAADRAAVATG